MNCACEQNDKGEVIGMCGAHWAYVRSSSAKANPAPLTGDIAALRLCIRNKLMEYKGISGADFLASEVLNAILAEMKQS